MLIAFEGMDGCGKSSISKLVAKKTGFKHYEQKIVETLNIQEDKYNDFIKKIRESDNKYLSFVFYTFRCMFDNDKSEKIIVERSMSSTYYFEHENVESEYFDVALTMGCKPDITFLLYASPEVRKKRIYSRNNADPDLESSEALKDGYPIMISFLKKYNLPYVEINSEKYNMEEIADICSDIIATYLNLEEEQKCAYLEKMNDEFGYYDKNNNKGVYKYERKI